VRNKMHSLDDFLLLLKGVKQVRDDQYTALCPGHHDTVPSLSLKEDDGKILVRCFAGCSLDQILVGLNLTTADLFLGDREPKQTMRRKKEQRTLSATFSYTGTTGKEIYQIRRYRPKKFEVWHRAKDGEYVPGLGGVNPIPYRLPELTEWISQKRTVYVPEGEGKVDRLVSLGLAATTVPFGAGPGKWLPDYNRHFLGTDVVILADNDKIGQEFAEVKAESLYGIASSDKVLLLPNLPPKGDIIDWLDNGGTKEELERLASDAPEWKPPNGATQAHFRLTKLSDLLREPAEDITYIWDNTLIRGGLSILVAKPKVGKSTLARNLAVAVAKGEPSFLGRLITISRPVVYLALEEKRSEVKRHFERMGTTDELPIFVHTGSAPEKAIDELRNAVMETQAVMAIVDPLQRLVRIPDLNDYSVVSLALEPLMQIARDTDCHLLLIHHATKGLTKESGDSILGSTAIFGSVDCALIMKRGESYRTIESIQRYGEDLPRTVLAFDVETGLTSSGGSLEDVEVAKCGEAILELLVDHEMVEAEIKEEITDHKGGIVSKSLRLLCREGEIQRQGSGKKGDPYRYTRVSKNTRDSGDRYIEIPTIPTIRAIDSSLKSDSLPKADGHLNPKAILGMPISSVLEIWRSEGAPLIHLGQGENCSDLERLLFHHDVSERDLQAVKTWLEKVLT